MQKNLLLATGNKNKAKEFNEILGNAFNVVTCPDPVEVKEYGASCASNAIIKAKGYYEALKADNIFKDIDYIIADDSGIFVPGLGDNFPGVLSARFAVCEVIDKEHKLSLKEIECELPKDIDRKNNELLLKLMQGKENRQAYFLATLALLDKNGEFLDLFEGLSFGQIGTEIIDESGFGYDHIFIADSGNHWGKTELNIKNKESHRGKVGRALCKFFDN